MTSQDLRDRAELRGHHRKQRAEPPGSVGAARRARSHSHVLLFGALLTRPLGPACHPASVLRLAANTRDRPTSASTPAPAPRCGGAAQSQPTPQSHAPRLPAHSAVHTAGSRLRTVYTRGARPSRQRRGELAPCRCAPRAGQGVPTEPPRPRGPSSAVVPSRERVRRGGRGPGARGRKRRGGRGKSLS